MTREERRILEIFRGLPEDRKKLFLEFSEFLHSRSHEETPVPSEPVPIPAPENESVVRAIKRLSATYPMIDRSRVFNETSSLMMQHVVQGRAAADVIAELEALFRRLYDEHAGRAGPSTGIS
ncbi:MAG: Crp/Fnr family transcriptional regulator [Acidiferrobacteraceae bacterium]